MNKAIIMGRLGKDPEVRYTSEGAMITSFSIATDESYKGKDGKKVEATEWHNITAFGKTAEICANYLAKGDQVLVSGKIKTRKWEDKDGVTRYSTGIVAGEINLIGSKKKEDGGGAQQPPFDPDEDIPF